MTATTIDRRLPLASITAAIVGRLGLADPPSLGRAGPLAARRIALARGQTRDLLGPGEPARERPMARDFAPRTSSMTP